MEFSRSSMTGKNELGGNALQFRDGFCPEFCSAPAWKARNSRNWKQSVPCKHVLIIQHNNQAVVCMAFALKKPNGMATPAYFCLTLKSNLCCFTDKRINDVDLVILCC